jgi:hypothetical protein
MLTGTVKAVLKKFKVEMRTLLGIGLETILYSGRALIYILYML